VISDSTTPPLKVDERPSRWLDSRWLGGPQPYLWLTALCLLLYLPGMVVIPPLDRDEARFAQATRQMLETGDYLRIRFQDEARNKKPAGIYWLQAASVQLFSTPQSTAIWPYRVPSLLGAIAACLITFAFAAALLRGAGLESEPRATAAIAAVLLASSLGVVAEAHIAKSDAVLLAAITAAQGALGIAYVRGRGGGAVSPWVAVVFWAAEIVAIMVKGPPGPALALVTVVALAIADGGARWVRSLWPMAGVAAVVLAITPWLVAIQGATGGRFLAESVGADLLSKIVDAQESHGAPPFSYLVLSFATFWPGSLLFVPAMVRCWRRRTRPLERLLLAWLVPAWVILELVPTKLPHYVLPLYPALALIAAQSLADEPTMFPNIWLHRLDIAVKAVWALVGVALAAALVVTPLRFGGQLSIFDLIGVAVLLGLIGVWLRYRPGRRGTSALSVALSLAFVVTAAWAVLPGLDRLWLSRSAAALVAQYPPAPGKPLVAVGYSEPSLVFLLGTNLRLATPRTAVETLAGGGEVLVSSREDAIFRQAAAAGGLSPEPLGNVPGIDYSNGQHMVLTLYRVAPG